jgi:hypothetical protein
MKKPKEPSFFEKKGIPDTPPPGGKVLLPGGAGGRNKKFHEIANFKKIKVSLKATGKLDMQYFNNAKDVGMFIDWYNQRVREENRRRGS